MHRIDAAGFAAGNLFTDGNPSTGTPATVVDAAWLNDLQENVAQMVEASGITLSKGDYSQLLKAVVTKGLQGSYFNIGTAAGTADAITASYNPAINALTNGMTLYVRAGSANVTNAPIFTPNSGTIVAKQIVKGAGAMLLAGDIAGGGHWIELQYDLTLDKWVLLNPANGVTASLAASGIATATTTGSLPASVVGATLLINSGSATTQTLPPASTVPVGRRLELMNVNTGTGTVSRAGTDTIAVNNTTLTSIGLGVGDTLTLECNGSNGWYAVGGSAQLYASAALGGSVAANGYQRFPNGLILQWGTASSGVAASLSVTFPIAFTSACYSVVATDSQGPAGYVFTDLSSISAMGFTMTERNASGTLVAPNFTWIAIGK